MSHSEARNTMNAKRIKVSFDPDPAYFVILKRGVIEMYCERAYHQPRGSVVHRPTNIMVCERKQFPKKYRNLRAKIRGAWHNIGFNVYIRPTKEATFRGMASFDAIEKASIIDRTDHPGFVEKIPENVETARVYEDDSGNNSMIAFNLWSHINERIISYKEPNPYLWDEQKEIIESKWQESYFTHDLYFPPLDSWSCKASFVGDAETPSGFAITLNRITSPNS